MNKKVEDILNLQIGKEGYSSNLYLSMACWAETEGYNGIAGWLYVQADEERMHMLKFVKYINERGGKAMVPEVKQPPVAFGDVQAMFKQVLEHEEYITNSINEIVALCQTEKDFTTQNWVQWFVNEQIEEEASVRLIIDKLKLVGTANMYIFDRDITGLRAAKADAAAE